MSRVTFLLGNVHDHNSMEHTYYVYILASKSRVLYVGVTNNLASRLRQHRDGTYSGFAEHYKTYRLVYYETFALGAGRYRSREDNKALAPGEKSLPRRT